MEMKDFNQDGSQVTAAEEAELKSKDKTYPSLIINAEQILTAARKAKRLTSGGLQHVSPWLLKRALLEDTTQGCATIAGKRLHAEKEEILQRY